MAFTTVPAAGAKLRGSVLSSLITEVRPLTAIKLSDETVNNSTTLQDDDELFLSVEANAKYWLDMRLLMSSGTTPDFKMLFTFPSGLTMKLHNTEATGTLSVPYDQTTTAAVSGTGADAVIQVEGLVKVSSTAGTLKLQWAQNTLNASNTIVRADSTMRLSRRS
jgi:hypothetical protein